jgi:hypothetical protein
MMKLIVLVALLLAGCAAPAVGNGSESSLEIFVQIDPVFEAPARAALVEWHEVTGARFVVTVAPVGGKVDGTWQIGAGSEHPHIARTYGPEDPATPLQTSHIRVDTEYCAQLGYTENTMRRVFLHEIAHALRITFTDDPVDPFHYHGSEPSMLRNDVTDVSEHLGRPEIDAYFTRVSQ